MLSRKSIRRIFEENRGAAARVARELGVGRAHICRWLMGDRESPIVERACRAEAERLLRGEGKSAAERGAAKSQGHTKKGRVSPPEGF
jgi:hypothetical protein